MSFRPTRKPPADGTVSVGRPLRTITPSPYNEFRHIGPKPFEDYDGGPWADLQPLAPTFLAVSQKWVVAPSLGSATPAISVFPRRLSNNVSFSNNVHLSFAQAWTPAIARFTSLILTDVDKKGNIGRTGQHQHWVSTFKGKTSDGLTAVILRIRVSDDGSELEGWAIYLPDTDFVLDAHDFPAPARGSQVGFDSSTAVVINKAFFDVDGDAAEVIFSKLDNSVERGRRIERAHQSFNLFKLDVAQRSKTTLETINFLRSTVYFQHFQGEPENVDFWEVDPESNP